MHTFSYFGLVCHKENHDYYDFTLWKSAVMVDVSESEANASLIANEVGVETRLKNYFISSSMYRGFYFEQRKVMLTSGKFYCPNLTSFFFYFICSIFEPTCAHCTVGSYASLSVRRHLTKIQT